MVGDGDAMSVACQVVKDMFSTAEGRLSINHPVLPRKGWQELDELAFLLQRRTCAVKHKLMVAKGVAQPSDELTPENTTEHFHGQEESGARWNPVRGREINRRREQHSGYEGVFRVSVPKCGGWRRSRFRHRGVWDRMATSRRVAALTSNSNENNRRLFCQLSGTRTCGTLKTRW